MFDAIKRFFGEGYIYSEFTCDDGTTGRARCAYIGDPETFDEAEHLIKLKNDIWFEHGKRVVKARSWIE